MVTEARPALYDHCCTVYEAMQEVAQRQAVEGIEEEVMVYEGFLTKLFADNQLAVPYYSSVMDNLQRMDCVRQIRRGGGTSPSLWALLQAPNTDLFDNMARSHTPKARRDRMDILEQQFGDLRRMFIDMRSEFELYKESHP